MIKDSGGEGLTRMTGLHQSDPSLNTKKACYNLFFLVLLVLRQLYKQSFVDAIVLGLLCLLFSWCYAGMLDVQVYPPLQYNIRNGMLFI